MDRADKMREKRASLAVKLIKLIKIYASDTNVLTCVFEGDDAKYYGVRIDGFLRNIERKNIICKGKSNLISLKEKVDLHQDLSSSKILFFADRDFDFEDSTNKNIYFTPCYSVENLYMESSVLKRILVDEFGLCEIDHKDDIERIIQIYTDLLSQMVQELLLLNAWIMCQNYNRDSGCSIKLNLNNFDVSHFVDFSLDGVVKKYDAASLKTTFPDSVSIPVDTIESAKESIERSGVIRFSRGKYLLEFFRIFLEMLRKEICNKNSELVKVTTKIKLTISKNNILSDLSQYALTPVCLIDFLRENLQEAA